MIKRYLLTILFLTLPLLGQEDYNVMDLPFLKKGPQAIDKIYQEVAEGFISSKTALEATQYLIDTSPEEVAEFSKSFRLYHQKRLGEIQKDLSKVNYSANQLAYITMALDNGKSNVIQLIWEKEMDSPKVDWRATYATGEMEWEEFIETQPQTPVLFRARLSVETQYFNYNHVDDQVWACYKVINPFLNQEIFAYIKREEIKKSEILQEIEENKFKDVVLSICYPEDIKDKKQVEITEIHYRGWHSKNYFNE